jgi:signal transduction histidine kinase
MSRRLLAAGVVLADTAVQVAGHRPGWPLWAVPVYALAVALVVALGSRVPAAALVTALVFASLTGGTYVLLLWASYHAGRTVMSRRGTALAAGAVLGWLCVQIADGPVDARAVSGLVSACLVFVALPLLAGRYLAQHERLVSALNQNNRQLRTEREVLAEQERLRERLRIAQDMHDSLGRWLSLVSIQAAALEVSVLPLRQRQAVAQLAGAARGAMDELYELVGLLRKEDVRDRHQPGAEAISKLVAEFQAAGVPVTLQRHGRPEQLPAAADHAAYRMAEEGLTNAAKHAPGRPVTVNVQWEPGALLLTIVNEIPDREAAQSSVPGAGQGLPGLAQRIRLAGGFLDHTLSGRLFRLFAMLPTAAGQVSRDDDLPSARPVRTAALGLTTAALMFVILPAAVLLGVR